MCGYLINESKWRLNRFDGLTPLMDIGFTDGADSTIGYFQVRDFFGVNAHDASAGRIWGGENRP